MTQAHVCWGSEEKAVGRLHWTGASPGGVGNLTGAAVEAISGRGRIPELALSVAEQEVSPVGVHCEQVWETEA